jgi:hypothetical protein
VMSEQIYGQLTSEKLANDNLICHKIVSEILNFGIDQRQLKLIIYSLALNIENIEQAQELSGVIKELCPDISISNLSSGDSNGSIIR